MTWIVIVNCGDEMRANIVAKNLRSKGVPARALNYVGDLEIPK